jgi:phosphate transport system substrate-binding protein
MTFAKKALCTAGLAAAAGVAVPVLAQATISGAGASFPAPFYQAAFQ